MYSVYIGFLNIRVGDRRKLEMKYCTKCGKPLQDGEVCSCQTQNTADAQTNTGDVQQASNEQQQATTTQQAATAQTAQPAAKPIITKEQATEISKGMLAYAKEFVKDPVGASEAVVGEHSLMTVAGLVVVNAALQIIYSLISIIVSTARGGHYSIGDWIMRIVRPVIWWVAIPAAFAGLIWVCAKYVEGQNVSFKKALSVFAIPALPLLAFTVLNILRLVLTHQFFSVIFGVVHAAIAGMMFYLTGVGIVKVLPLSKKFIYSIAIICAGLYFVNWLVTMAIF